jgi:O-antigen ligase
MTWLWSERVQHWASLALIASFVATAALMTAAVDPKYFRPIYYAITLPAFAITAKRAELDVITRSWVWRLVTALFAYMALSVLWSDHYRAIDFLQVARRLILTWLFFTIAIHLALAAPRFRPTLFRALVVAAAAAALWQVTHEYLAGYAPGDRIWLAGLTNANISAAIFGVVVIGGFFYGFRGLTAKAPLLGLAVCLFIALLFFGMTQSRGPLLAFVVALLLTGMTMRTRWVFAGAALVAAATGGLFAAGILNYANLARRGDSYRLEILEHYLTKWREHPWFGIGALSDPRFTSASGYLLEHEHNVYVAYLVQGGALSLALLVAALMVAARAAWLHFRHTRDFGLVALLAFIAICIGTDFTIFIENIGWQAIVLWVPLGLIAAAEISQAQSRPATPPGAS